MRSPSGCEPPTPSPSGPPSHERPQAEPVSDTAEPRRLLADRGARGRLPDPLQEPRGQRLSGARKIPNDPDRRRAVVQLPVSYGMTAPPRLPSRQNRHGDP